MSGWLILQSAGLPGSSSEATAGTPSTATAVPGGDLAKTGRRLFLLNCAHCHGDDARGDEGPTLFNLTLGNASITRKIKEGIRGEMPRFGSKLSDADIQALIAYLRTLKDRSVPGSDGLHELP